MSYTPLARELIEQGTRALTSHWPEWEDETGDHNNDHGSWPSPEAVAREVIAAVRDMGWLNLVVEKDTLLTMSQVAEMFDVNPKTITRWCQDGKIPSVKTLGGHRRIYRSAILPHLKAHYENET